MSIPITRDERARGAELQQADERANNALLRRLTDNGFTDAQARTALNDIHRTSGSYGAANIAAHDATAKTDAAQPNAAAQTAMIRRPSPGPSV